MCLLVVLRTAEVSVGIDAIGNDWLIIQMHMVQVRQTVVVLVSLRLLMLRDFKNVISSNG